jgi:methylenetetrahydrofolate reductase (NADPH)
VPGIIPVLSLQHIQRFTAMGGTTLPAKLSTRLEVAAENTDVVETIGIDWALTQIRDLLAHGARGTLSPFGIVAKAPLALTAGPAA